MAVCDRMGFLLPEEKTYSTIEDIPGNPLFTAEAHPFGRRDRSSAGTRVQGCGGDGCAEHAHLDAAG